MVFYKGAVSYESLSFMPIPELLDLQESAEKIISIREKKAAKYGK